jgi:trimeric autotransporter adhesin
VVGDDDAHTRVGATGAVSRHAPPLRGSTPLSLAAAVDCDAASASADRGLGRAVAAVAFPHRAGAGTGAEADGEAAALREAPASPVAGDELWARTFGAINVAAYPGVIAVRGEQVYLGGTFTVEMAGLPNDTYVRVARWDGSSWRRMGDGVDAAVHAIAVVGDEVYVGGEFSVAGGTPAARLARWDGVAWSEVAGGIGSSRSWASVSVRALACDGTKLYVAGAFDSAGSGSAAIAANGFAALDLGTGIWETYDGGLWFSLDPGEGRALAVAGDRLYVGGSFERAGTVETA